MRPHPNLRPTAAPADAGRRAVRRARPTARARRALAAVSAVVLCAALAGCGVRIDSAAPGPRTPGPDEVARAATVADLVAVRDLAQRTLHAGASAGVDRATTPRLTSVASLATRQIAALGGVYAGPATTPAPAPTPAAATVAPTRSTATVEAVVARLAADDAAARARLGHVADPHLARLVAQVGTSQHLSAVALARAAGTTAPRPAAKLPAPVPHAVPAGARASVVATLVASEDGAGYALEVLAARASGAQRSQLAARAAVHRARAQAWADAAGLSGTTGDPRLGTYALPASASTARRTIENGLAARYAALLDTLAPAGRAAVADLLADCARAAVDAGAGVAAFPGGTPKQPAAGTPTAG